MRRSAVTAPVLALATVAALAGCGGEKAKETVAVTTTDSTCDVAKTTLTPGTYKFAVRNDGKQETEFYVYTKAGKKVEEVEGIAPGTSRSLTAKLDPGSYELACKPGQKDPGIRTPLTVS